MVSIYTNIFNNVPNIIYFEWLPHTYQLPYLVVKTLAIKHAKSSTAVPTDIHTRPHTARHGVDYRSHRSCMTQVTEHYL